MNLFPHYPPIVNKTALFITTVVIHLPNLFWYMYPFKFILKIIGVGEKKLFVLEKNPGFWKFLPYYLILIFITGLTELGSTCYVLLTYFSHKSSNSSFKFYNALISFTVGIASSIQLVGTLTVLFIPEFILSFNALGILHLNCELNLIKFCLNLPRWHVKL